MNKIAYYCIMPYSYIIIGCKKITYFHFWHYHTMSLNNGTFSNFCPSTNMGIGVDNTYKFPSHLLNFFNHFTTPNSTSSCSD